MGGSRGWPTMWESSYLHLILESACMIQVIGRRHRVNDILYQPNTGCESPGESGLDLTLSSSLKPRAITSEGLSCESSEMHSLRRVGNISSEESIWAKHHSIHYVEQFVIVMLEKHHYTIILIIMGVAWFFLFGYKQYKLLKQDLLRRKDLCPIKGENKAI